MSPGRVHSKKPNLLTHLVQGFGSSAPRFRAKTSEVPGASWGFCAMTTKSVRRMF